MEDKISFLKNNLVTGIASIPEQTQPKWGKMTVQHMTEHMAREGFSWASGKVIHSLQSPEEHLPKLQAFVLSDMPFREPTANKLMPEELLPLVCATQEEALAYLQREMDDFFTVFQQEPDKKVLSPFFGSLDYDLSIHLLYKHSMHHLRQFGVNI